MMMMMIIVIIIIINATVFNDIKETKIVSVVMFCLFLFIVAVIFYDSSNSSHLNWLSRMVN